VGELGAPGDPQRRVFVALDKAGVFDEAKIFTDHMKGKSK